MCGMRLSKQTITDQMHATRIAQISLQTVNMALASSYFYENTAYAAHTTCFLYDVSPQNAHLRFRTLANVTRNEKLSIL